MRPVRITIEGFSAYRKRVEVDFDGVEYFSLSGATGSGKSSLIDAMVFALYGRVPRLGGATVAPAISTGRDQATVAFDFMVGDHVYTVVRDLHRTKSGGATVREARLERGSENIESGAKNVTAAVEELLRLSFEDFTRTVILPQGEFAKFLTATPSERQQLLRGLLGLDVYGEVGSRARVRESETKALAQQAQSRLEGMELPSEETMKTALDRLVAIGKLADSIGEKESNLLEVEMAVANMGSTVEALADARNRLSNLNAPERLDELGDLLGKAADSVEALEQRREKLELEKHGLEQQLMDFPSVERIDRIKTIQARLEEVEGEISRADHGTEASLKSAEEEVGRLANKLEMVTESLEASRVAHAAHDLASKLSPGDTCPVCDRLIDSPLATTEMGDLDGIRETVVVIEKDLDAGRSQVSRLTEKLAVERTRLAGLQTKRDELKDELDSDVDPAAIDDLKIKLAETIDRSTRVKVEVAEVASALKEARRELEDRAEEQRSLGNRLMAQREAIADLKPDRADSEDPIVQWKELMTWRERKLISVESEFEQTSKQLEVARKAHDADRRELEALLASLQIAVDGKYSVAVARAQEQARHQVEVLEKVRQDAAGLSTQITEQEKRGAVARVLSQHLRADGFERWLMVGAIARLVGGANLLLAQLSSDGYSLQADDAGSLDVIDHHNADEVRPISTLSGGETFLVSLALALSLAETLSAAGGAGLDAIILDEGFGTLDDELLEVVATVLADLASRGLMVGIITHVKELAGLAPVRFRVSKEPDGAWVEMVS